MAKKSTIETNKRRMRMVERDAAKRAALKAIAEDPKRPAEERFQARMKLNELPKNGSKIRIRNRCEVTGRPRAFYRRFKISRIALRDLASTGQLPGVVKSSW